MGREGSFDELQAKVGDIGWYQLRVFVATQLGYLAITGSMLCTIYDTRAPLNLNCSLVGADPDWVPLDEDVEFHSMLAGLGLLCGAAYTPTLLSSAVMGGGVLGACVWGYVADRWGRKWSNVIPLGAVAGLNFLIAGLGGYALSLSALLLALLGFFGGGFMVTNVIFLLEAMGGQFWRLGAAAVNGWPAGFMLMALLAFLTRHWRYFHVALGAAALPILAVQIFLTFESPRWLLQYQRKEEAHQILLKIGRINGQKEEVTAEEVDAVAAAGAAQAQAHKRYSYFDLLKHRQVIRFITMFVVNIYKILIRLCALFYSWLASSIVSFGVYFILGKLSGNFFLNTFYLGLLKGLTGVIPFLVARWVGRKPILLVGAAVACLSSWAAVLIYALHPEPASSAWLTVFALLGAGAIDPIWKVNHLYSAELFPTVVRNMARAVCNVGSRAGSIIAPQVAFLATAFAPAPFVVFGVLSVIHVVVSAVFLPETKGVPLPDRLPDGSVIVPVKAQESVRKETRF